MASKTLLAGLTRKQRVVPESRWERIHDELVERFEDARSGKGHNSDGFNVRETQVMRKLFHF